LVLTETTKRISTHAGNKHLDLLPLLHCHRNLAVVMQFCDEAPLSFGAIDSGQSAALFQENLPDATEPFAVRNNRYLLQAPRRPSPQYLTCSHTLIVVYPATLQTPSAPSPRSPDALRWECGSPGFTARKSQSPRVTKTCFSRKQGFLVYL
jgi:hypothetical protein